MFVVYRIPLCTYAHMHVLYLCTCWIVCKTWPHWPQHSDAPTTSLLDLHNKLCPLISNTPGLSTSYMYLSNKKINTVNNNM